MFIRALTLCLLSISTLSAADWPQHLGPQRTGHSAETDLLSTWPADGLKSAWKVSGGVGMSGIAVKDSLAVTLIQKAGNQFAIGLDTTCLLYTSPSPRDKRQSRMPSSA